MRLGTPSRRGGPRRGRESHAANCPLLPHRFGPWLIFTGMTRRLPAVGLQLVDPSGRVHADPSPHVAMVGPGLMPRALHVVLGLTGLDAVWLLGCRIIQSERSSAPGTIG